MRILLVFVFLFFPFSVFGQFVVINEIAWMGTPAQGVEEKQWWRYEWLELYNTKDQPLQIDAWTIELSREEPDFRVSLSGVIPAHGYFLAGASEKIPNLDLNYKNLGGKFFNGGQKVVLKNSLGEVIDEVNALLGWPAGDNKTKQTMERKAGSDPTTPAPWYTSAEPGGTPKTQNSEGYQPPAKKVKNTGDSNDISLQNEKDLFRSFESRVPVVNPIALVAGLVALGFSGVLVALKRFLVLGQQKNQGARPEPLEYPRGKLRQRV
jgi:hypothetical protein